MKREAYTYREAYTRRHSTYDTFDEIADVDEVPTRHASLVDPDEIVVQLDMPTVVRRQPREKLRDPQGIVAFMRLQ